MALCYLHVCSVLSCPYASKIAGEDYTMVMMDLTFNSDNSRGCVEVPITDDNLLEENETFTVTLTTEDTSAMLGNPTMTTVTLLASDCKYF